MREPNPELIMDAILQRTGQLHEWSQIVKTAADIRTASGNLFTLGNNVTAHAFRSTADAQDGLARELRRKYDEGKTDEYTWEDLSAAILEKGGW